MKPTRKRASTLSQIGEFGLIREIQRVVERHGLRQSSVILGIGDDCAVLRGDHPEKLLLFTSDPVVEGVHYLRNTPPRQIGWKAMARNLSDIAAMGGMPHWAVVNIGVRRQTTAGYVKQLYRGLRSAAVKFGCQIVGGDTAHVARDQFVVVAMVGEVEKTRLTLRSGARIGDSVFVTGSLGGSIRGKHLKFIPRIAEARWLTENLTVHSMMDVSDGLSSDLQRLVEANNARVGFEIFAAELPIAPAARRSLSAALNDGEDFELLFTVDPRDVTALRRKWARKFRLPLAEIGRVVHSPGKVFLVDRDGQRRELRAGGYDHFAGRSR